MHGLCVRACVRACVRVCVCAEAHATHIVEKSSKVSAGHCATAACACFFEWRKRWENECSDSLVLLFCQSLLPRSALLLLLLLLLLFEASCAGKHTLRTTRICSTEASER